MKNKPLDYGILLAVLTVLLFFIVYYFFIGFSYYDISLKINVFILPFIYTFISVVLLYKITNIQRLSFLECFKTSFITLFIGGTLSFFVIIFFLNYIDSEAQVLLQHQRIEKETVDLVNAYKELKKPTEDQVSYYDGLMKYYESDIAKNDPLFNFKKSSVILTGIYFFYIIISLLLSLFFRLRKPNGSINSNTPS